MSRFVNKYVESCEVHLKSASNLWRNIKYLQSHSRKLEANFKALTRMAASTGPQFLASVKDDMSRAGAEVRQVRQLLSSRNCSHWVVNEHLCSAAARISRIHGLVVAHGGSTEAARDAKGSAITRLGHQQDKFSGACKELSAFITWYDGVNAQRDKWKILGESERLVAVRDAFETAEAMTQNARSHVEAPIESWVDECDHDNGATSLLSKAEQSTAAAIATLKREKEGLGRLGAGESPSASFVAGDDDGDCGKGDFTLESKDSQRSSVVTEPLPEVLPKATNHSAASKEPGGVVLSGAPERALASLSGDESAQVTGSDSDEGIDQEESDETVHEKAKVGRLHVEWGKASKGGDASLPKASVRKLKGTEWNTIVPVSLSASTRPEPDPVCSVGKLDVKWGKKEEGPAKPFVEVGRLPSGVWKESQPAEVQRPAKPPPRKWATGAADLSDAAQNEGSFAVDAAPLAMAISPPRVPDVPVRDGEEEEEEEEEDGPAALDSRSVGKLDVKWGEKEEGPAKRAVEVRRLPEDMWKESQLADLKSPSEAQPIWESAGAVVSPTAHGDRSVRLWTEPHSGSAKSPAKAHPKWESAGAVVSPTAHDDRPVSLWTEPHLGDAESPAKPQPKWESAAAMHSPTVLDDRTIRLWKDSQPEEVQRPAKPPPRRWNEFDLLGELSIAAQPDSKRQNIGQEATKALVDPSAGSSRRLDMRRGETASKEKASEHEVGKISDYGISSPLTNPAERATLSEVLSQQPVGRVPAEWRSPVDNDEDGPQDPSLDPVVGKLTGAEWSPAHFSLSPSGALTAGASPGSADEIIAASFVQSPGVEDVLGIVSRSKKKFDSSTIVAPESTAIGAQSSEPRYRNMGAVVGLVSRLVGVFDDSRVGPPQNTTNVVRRPVQLRNGRGARRAKIDAMLALAASRTKHRQPGPKQDSLKKHEVQLLENVFRSYDTAGTAKINMQVRNLSTVQPSLVTTAHFPSLRNSRSFQPQCPTRRLPTSFSAWSKRKTKHWRWHRIA